MLATRAAPALSPLRTSSRRCQVNGVAAVRSILVAAHQQSSIPPLSTTVALHQRNGCNPRPNRTTTSGDGGGSGGKSKRTRYFLGAMASAAATAALIREGLLPDVFFDWDNQVDWEEVHQLAQLSNMTNKSPSLIRKWFDCHGYTGQLVVRNHTEVSSRYFVHRGHLPGKQDKPVCHVAIRGTVSLNELNIDFRTRLVLDEEVGCVFHGGFKKVADAVADDLERFLERDGPPIMLTGHSLGGAVATIAAAKLKIRGYRIGKVMTFGTPKITDACGAERLHGFLPLLRVTHERDPVPLMPFARAAWRVALADQEEITGTVLDAPELEAETGDMGPSALCDAAPGVPLTSVPGYLDSDTDVLRRRPNSVMAYSHFGSQVILMQRRACMECWREKNSLPDGAKMEMETRAAARRLDGPWDDIWGPAPTVQDDKEEGYVKRVKSTRDCGHCPSRGRSYYDPHGDDGCVFDTALSRLVNMNYTHRMGSYEHEVADRMDHVLQNRTASEVMPRLVEASLPIRRLSSSQPSSPKRRTELVDERLHDGVQEAKAPIAIAL